MKPRIAVMALILAGAQMLAPLAEAAMPKQVQPAATQRADIEQVDLVCDFSGCYQTWDRPPPVYRPRPVPPGYRPPPPPPGYYPPSVYDEPPVYRPRPRPPVYVEPGYRPPRNAWARHVEWCLNRYRSYDPRTNEFLSSAGRYRVCRSPFN